MHTNFMVRKCPWHNNFGLINQPVISPSTLQRGTNRLEMKRSNAMETINRYYDLRENLHDIAPDMLIADGDINALRLAQRWKIPSVYIANMIRPSYGFSSFLSPGERLVERYVKQCSKIIIPDNPAPYTVSEYNIGNLDNMNLNRKVEYVGSFVDTTPVEGEQVHIFAPISGSSRNKGEANEDSFASARKTKNKMRHKPRHTWQEDFNENWQLRNPHLAVL